MIFIVRDYNNNYVNTITIPNPDNYDQLFYYRQNTFGISRTSSQNYDYHYRSFTLNWSNLEQSEFYEIISLIAKQNFYNIYFVNNTKFLKVKFEGDVVFQKDSCLDVSTLTIKMVGIE